MARRSVAVSLKRARHEVYRRVLVEAAESIFADRGFAQAKMQDVAAKAGISVGVLYEVFPSKEALLAAVHEDRGKELLDRAAALVPGHTPLEVLLSGIELLVGFFEAHPAYLRLHLRDGITWAHPELSRGLDVSTWEGGLAMLATAFASGRDDASLVDDDPQGSARLLMGMIQICLTDWLVSRPRPAADEVIARLKTLVVRTFVRSDEGRRSSRSTKAR